MTSNGSREHPDAFDRGLKRRGLEPLSKKLVALDEKRRAAITKTRAGAGAAERGLEGYRRRQEGERRGQGQQADGRSCRAQDIAAGNGGASRRRSLLNSTTELGADPESHHSTTCRTVPMPEEMSSIIVVGKKRDYAFKPRQHFELGEALGMMDFELAAKLSGARFVVLQKDWRAWNAHSGNSCSMCIRARSMDTRRSIRQSWFATM